MRLSAKIRQSIKNQVQ
ncbi:rCG33337 [Rattus norvegicus]|uniref:RCG33337 n=1 Tax=Rattus norvegicus TaxID=10116 RepID=A6HJY6_RAT|nr:rCG33337 [Rattus norvegicus]